MENNMETMEKVLDLLKTSQDALKSAIDAIHALGSDDSPVCKILIEINGDGCEDGDGKSSEPEPAFNLISALHDVGIQNVEDRIFLVPTAYGNAALLKPSNMCAFLEESDSVEGDANVDWMRVTVCGDTIIRDNGQGDWILFCGCAGSVKDYNYVIPIHTDQFLSALHRYQKNTVYHGVKYGAFEDMPVILQTLCNMDLLTIELPEVYLKVTKPGMVCKDQQYELHKLFTYDGIPVLHKCGFHFAADRLTLLQWYPEFSKDNELYLVQVGKNTEIDENGIGVTDSILFVEQVDWSKQ